MDTFFRFVDSNQVGIAMLILLLIAMMVIVQWMFWLLGRGRYAGQIQLPKGQPIAYLLTEALTKIINDFRHFLALILVLVFATALAVALYQAGKDMEAIKDALQAVTSTLGGLVGSIIGYYFGESKARREAEIDASPDNIQVVQPPNMGPLPAPSAAIQETPRPI